MLVSLSTSRFLLQTRAPSANSCRDALATLDLVTTIPLRELRYAHRQASLIVHSFGAPHSLDGLPLLLNHYLVPTFTSGNRGERA